MPKSEYLDGGICTHPRLPYFTSKKTHLEVIFSRGHRVRAVENQCHLFLFLATFGSSAAYFEETFSFLGSPFESFNGQLLAPAKTSLVLLVGKRSQRKTNHLEALREMAKWARHMVVEDGCRFL